MLSRDIRKKNKCLFNSTIQATIDGHSTAISENFLTTLAVGMGERTHQLPTERGHENKSSGCSGSSMDTSTTASTDGSSQPFRKSASVRTRCQMVYAIMDIFRVRNWRPHGRFVEHEI